MRVIDLLNKIANGEEPPKKIKFEYGINIYEYNYEDYWDDRGCEYLFKNSNILSILNKKIEIIDCMNKEK